MYSEILKYTSERNVALVAVSKTKPNADIMVLYEKGQRIFGENRVQEVVEKHEALPKDINWHLIGHLQKNKVKYIAPFISMIHSVDSIELLIKIQKEAHKNDRIISVLLQFHIAQEETKFGLDLDEAKQILEALKEGLFEHIIICGVMGMATFTNDTSKVRKEFAQLKSFFSKLKETYFFENDSFEVISMGMSGDYKLAIEEGSNMVRIGSAIFGDRN